MPDNDPGGGRRKRRKWMRAKKQAREAGDFAVMYARFAADLAVIVGLFVRR